MPLSLFLARDSSWSWSLPISVHPTSCLGTGGKERYCHGKGKAECHRRQLGSHGQVVTTNKIVLEELYPLASFTVFFLFNRYS